MNRGVEITVKLEGVFKSTRVFNYWYQLLNDNPTNVRLQNNVINSLKYMAAAMGEVRNGEEG